MSQECQSCHHPLTSTSAPVPEGHSAEVPCGHCGKVNLVGHANPPPIVVQPATGVTAVSGMPAEGGDIARRVWFIEGSGGRQGPLTAVDVLAQRRAGAIGDETPIFGPEMTAARPLREVMPQLEARPAAPQAPGWHPAAEAAWQQVQGASASEDSGFGNEHTRNIVAPRAAAPASAPAGQAGEFESEHTRNIVAPRAASQPAPANAPDPRLNAALFDEALRQGGAAPAAAPQGSIPAPSAVAASAPAPRQSQVTMLGHQQQQGGNKGLKIAIAAAVALGLGGAGFAAWFVSQRAPSTPAAAPAAAPAPAAK